VQFSDKRARPAVIASTNIFERTRDEHKAARSLAAGFAAAIAGSASGLDLLR
jgi:hypothetical protein